MRETLRQLHDLAEAGTPAIDRFVATHRFPLVSEQGVTFLYRGEADAVQLRHWVYGLPALQPFQRVADSPLWSLELELPQGSRIEYKIQVVRGDREEWLRDPLNPLSASDPFGANSVCRAYGYRRPQWTRADPLARRGRLEELQVPSRAFGEARAVKVYVPARFRPTRRYRLLVTHDGDDFLHYAGLEAVLDNLVHSLEVEPLVVALTSSPERLREYADHPAHARFLAEELVPALQARFPLRDEPAARCLMGASFGAVAALSAAWRFPGFYGSLLLQSGSFAFTDIGANRREPVFDPVVRFVNAFREAPGRPAQRLFVSCGLYESLIYENRSLVPLLQQHGMQVRYVEAPDGHNWENWRDRLRDGLSWLFPGPLWMVYE